MKAQFIIDLINKINEKISGSITEELGALDMEKNVTKNLGSYIFAGSVLLIGIILAVILIQL